MYHCVYILPALPTAEIQVELHSPPNHYFHRMSSHVEGARAKPEREPQGSRSDLKRLVESYAAGVNSYL